MSPERIAAAAERLYLAHKRGERFAPLPADLAPQTAEDAYAIQDEFVALRAEKLGPIVGYKISLASAKMRRMVGIDVPQSGVLLEAGLYRTPARIRAADYVRPLVEFEIAVEMAEDLPAADAPFSREQMMRAIGAVMPAIEIVDDRGADHTALAKRPFDLVADNGWNEGAVLGYPIDDWRRVDFGHARGVARINGKTVGEGIGAETMGHPFEAAAWIANHLAAHERGLMRTQVVITGSLITSKAVQAGDLVQFTLEGVGDVELRVD